MKKIILILLIILMSGCYDYNELTDLGLVSSMLVDYVDDEFVINLEILDSNKEIVNPSYFIEGKGKTFESALNDIYNKSTTHIYLSHMNAVILSKTVSQEKLSDIYDYFLREIDIRKDSYFLVSDNINQFKEFESPDNLSIGVSLKNIIEYNEKENAYFKTYEFRDIINSYLNDKNYLLGEIHIDDNNVTLGDVYLVHDNKLDMKLDRKAVLLANLLENTTSTFLIMPSDTFRIYKYKLDKNVSKNKISINLKANMRLTRMEKSDSTNKSDLNEIEKEANKYLKKYITDSINYAKINDRDIYNLDYLYKLYEPNSYKKGIWKDLKIDVNVNTIVNEKGLLTDTLRGEN